MAIGYRNSAGVDFDDLFDFWQSGAQVGAVGYRDSAGNDIGPRYAPISIGSKGPDVGYRDASGIDLSNKWAAKGTATYAGRGGVPDLVEDVTVVSPSGGSAAAYVSYGRNGIVTWSTSGGGSSGTWAPGGGTPGDAYDIKYQQLSVSGGASMTGADNVWRQINADRICSLGVFASGGASRSGNGSANVQIRRRSDGAVIVNYNLNFYASVTSDG